jgi:Fuc2NAc and GlcNAc transferase
MAGAALIAAIGRRSGLLDEPGRRSSHQIPTPKGGGIGILAAFIVGGLWMEIAAHFLLICSLVAFLGLLSDRMHIAPKRRLFIQLICALGVMVLSYDHVLRSSGFLGLVVTAGCIYIVGTANFYNFMDGINGIAGITAIVAYGLCGYYLSTIGYDNRFQLLLVCIVGSVVGFLPFNIPKARVFMGDVGSILLGFLYGCIVVLASRTGIDFICMASFLFLFYADELTTMVIRLRAGESLLKAHRRHLYQILANELGYRHWVVSAGYGFLQLVIGINVLLVVPYGMGPVLGLLFLYGCTFIAVTAWVRRCLPVQG